MKALVGFYQSTIGKKVVVAITGLALFGFVFGHMVGNLKIFMGYDRHGVHHIDAYGNFLRVFLEDAFGYSGFLWILRVGLIVCLFLHVVTIIQLQRIKSAARTTDYKKTHYKATTLAAQTMMIGGIIIFAFVIFHLLHLTLGTVLPGFVHGEVYANLHKAFASPAIVLVYILSMIAVTSHLHHGIWSMLQTLGIDNPDRNTAIRFGAKGISLIIFLGFSAVPLAIFFGLLEEPRASLMKQ